jgi:FKBP-type peptidyl-prolyl cis-trans isomerase FklB
MQKSFTSALALSVAAPLLLASAWAQQNPTPPAKTPPAKTSSTTTAHHAAATKKAPPLTLKTQKDKFSYALGMNLGANLHKQSVDVDPAILLQGLKDATAGGKTLMTDDEARAALMETQNELRKKQQEKMQALGEQNKKDGDVFLAANKTKEGVVTLPSGLQYKILSAGTGPKPTPTDTVVCNYRGTLLDGKEFDSSFKRGQPATFPVGRVIKGWTEALQLMPVGSKWQLFIPPDLAYADHGAGPDIGPNATLTFEVELLSIQDKNAPKPGDKPMGNIDKPDLKPDDKAAASPSTAPPPANAAAGTPAAPSNEKK